MLGDFFQIDPDLRLTGTEVYLDARTPRDVGIVSHGHSDHIARHDEFIATPPTAAFIRHRLGSKLRGTELPFGVVHSLGAFDLKLFPAGHVLGSAMAKLTRGGRSLLYTGDFRLAPSLTAERAVVPKVDAVVTESTYGSEQWVFPSRDEIEVRLRSTIGDVLRRGRTPVLLAYSLGKAQEVCRMLRDLEPPLVVHPSIAAINRIYKRFEVDLGRWEVWSDQGSLDDHASVGQVAGRVVVIPPHLGGEVSRVAGAETIALTGWSLHAPWRVRADHGIPLSDHADFPELINLVSRAEPEIVYVTHGSKQFVEELRRRGWKAEYLRRRPQMRLF